MNQNTLHVYRNESDFIEKNTYVQVKRTPIKINRGGRQNLKPIVIDRIKVAEPANNPGSNNSRSSSRSNTPTAQLASASPNGS